MAGLGVKMISVAVPARISSNGRLARRPKRKISPLEDMILQLYSRGLGRGKIARIMNLQMLQEMGRTGDEKRDHRRCRNRLKRMEETNWFRDELWRRTTVGLDLKSPQIVDGIAQKAIKGDVPAAKFALELAGRYEEKGTQVASTVVVNFGGLPRPERAHMDEVQSDEDVEDADWEGIESHGVESEAGEGH